MEEITIYHVFALLLFVLPGLVAFLIVMGMIVRSNNRYKPMRRPRQSFPRLAPRGVKIPGKNWRQK